MSSVDPKRPAPGRELDENGVEKPCFPCRVTGTVVMGSVSAWSWWEFSRVPRSKVGDRIAFALIGTAAGAFSLYRALGY